MEANILENDGKWALSTYFWRPISTSFLLLSSSLSSSLLSLLSLLLPLLSLLLVTSSFFFFPFPAQFGKTSSSFLHLKDVRIAIMKSFETKRRPRSSPKRLLSMIPTTTTTTGAFLEYYSSFMTTEEYFFECNDARSY